MKRLPVPPQFPIALHALSVVTLHLAFGWQAGVGYTAGVINVVFLVRGCIIRRKNAPP